MIQTKVTIYGNCVSHFWPKTAQIRIGFFLFKMKEPYRRILMLLKHLTLTLKTNKVCPGPSLSNFIKSCLSS